MPNTDAIQRRAFQRLSRRREKERSRQPGEGARQQLGQQRQKTPDTAEGQQQSPEAGVVHRGTASGDQRVQERSREYWDDSFKRFNEQIRPGLDRKQRTQAAKGVASGDLDERVARAIAPGLGEQLSDHHAAQATRTTADAQMRTADAQAYDAWGRHAPQRTQETVGEDGGTSQTRMTDMSGAPSIGGGHPDSVDTWGRGEDETEGEGKVPEIVSYDKESGIRVPAGTPGAQHLQEGTDAERAIRRRLLSSDAARSNIPQYEAPPGRQEGAGGEGPLKRTDAVTDARAARQPPETPPAGREERPPAHTTRSGREARDSFVAPETKEAFESAVTWFRENIQSRQEIGDAKAQVMEAEGISSQQLDRLIEQFARENNMTGWGAKARAEKEFLSQKMAEAEVARR